MNTLIYHKNYFQEKKIQWMKIIKVLKINQKELTVHRYTLFFFHFSWRYYDYLTGPAVNVYDSQSIKVGTVLLSFSYKNN